ncbi:MAG: hypothetical protein H7A46_16005 [Verrucomicrobiales bacterium]|nr:hypothetical protein [Verrucomicrobiales bacterium]
MRLCLLGILLTCPIPMLAAADLHVWSDSAGPVAPYVSRGTAARTLEEAVAAARPGDTILVHPRPDNRPYERVALNLDTPRLTVRGVGEPAGNRVPLSGRGFDYSGRGRTPRAMVQFNAGADGCVLEGFDLSGAHNESHNGAGVRLNQANQVTVRDCVIHHNDMGIMSNGNGTPHAAVDQSIERCLVHSNGDPADPGYNHNLYLGGTSVTLLGCEVHSSLTGHNVKSRAHRTTVLVCFIHDAANREFDLVDARGDTDVPQSHAVLAGNVIVKAPDCAGNRGVIHFGQDGGHGHDGTLFLVHNTIVTPFVSPVVQLSAEGTRAEFWNNLVSDGGARQHNQRLISSDGVMAAGRIGGSCNRLAAGFVGPDFAALGLRDTGFLDAGGQLPFADPAHGDYRLVRKVTGITEAGCVLPAGLRELIGRPLPQYGSPPGWRERSDEGKPDLGAFDGGAGGARAR